MANHVTEAMRSALMPLGNLPVEQVEERLLDARRSYRLNLRCLQCSIMEINHSVVFCNGVCPTSGAACMFVRRCGGVCVRFL